MDNLARLKLRTNEPDEAILEDCLESKSGDHGETVSVPGMAGGTGEPVS